MALSLVGTASATGTTVTLPTHAVGDLLIVSARRASNTIPTAPTGGGTVPYWNNVIVSAGANTLSMMTVMAVATATNHTSGTFTNAAHLTAAVIRTNTSGAIPLIGAATSGNGSAVQTIVYPAATLRKTDSTSLGVRIGTRTVAVTTVATAPSGWTNQTVIPAGASALMALHTRTGLAANPTADTVSTTGTSAAYRAHTLEVVDFVMPSTVVGPVDDFDTGSVPDGAKWAAGGVIAPTLSGGRLRLQSAAAGSDYAGIVNATGTLSLTGKTMYAKPSPSPVSGSHEAILEFRRDDDTTGLQVMVSATDLNYGLGTGLILARAYNATQDTWWRMAEVGGTVAFFTSPDGTLWCPLGSIATPAWVGLGYTQFFAGHWNDPEAAATDTFVDNFNTTGAGGAPITIPLQASASTGTATLGLRAVPKLALSASGAATGTLALLVVGAANLGSLSSPSVATGALNLTTGAATPAVIPLSASPAVATGTLGLRRPVIVAGSSSGVATASLGLRAPPRLGMSSSAVASGACGVYAPSSGSNDSIVWSGYTWWVRDWPGEPGNLPAGGDAQWSKSTTNVRVEGTELVLSIVNNGTGGVWTNAEIDCDQHLGYGTYTWVVNTRLDNIDSYDVLGLFTWGDGAAAIPPNLSNNEIDIEAARWGDPLEQEGSTSVWQDFANDIRSTVLFDYTASPPYTCKFKWEAGKVTFTITDSTATVLHTRQVTSGVPVPSNEIPIINYWRHERNTPSSQKSMRIASFTWAPISNNAVLPLQSAPAVASATNLALFAPGIAFLPLSSSLGRGLASLSMQTPGAAYLGLQPASAVGAATLLLNVLSAPANILKPALIGSPLIGSSLTCDPGVWSGSPAPTFVYQWNRNGGAIAGATNSTYTVAIADDGQAITCTVTATNVRGSASATSEAITGGAPPVPPTPNIILSSAGTRRLDYYRFELAHSADLSRIGELTQARNRRLQLALNRAGAFTCDLPLDHDLTDSVTEAETCIVISRNGEIIWSGPIWTVAENISAGTASLQVGAVGWLQTLDKRVVRPSWNNNQPITYTSQDAAVIALDLLARTNNDALANGAPLFLTPGTGESTQLRTRTYQPWSGILSSITELTEIESGFDLEVTPQMRKLNIRARVGQDNGVIFELPGDINSVSRSTDSSRIINYMTGYSQIGAASEADYDSIVRYGLFEEAQSLSDVINPTILLAFAAGEIYVKSRPLRIITFQPKADSYQRPHSPRVFRDYNIGDTVRLTARHGRVHMEQQLLRLFSFSVNFPDTGGAAVSDVQTTAGG